ncbi:MAG: hypothetical protein ABR66_03075 [Microbacteriaceae bacterium BACL25 MAG-120322-bin65]|nr:MAG: hypothetical protein ABR66_03075 [Microbacteriaceae bacterium BACL25 MAG-120322-bin65]
MATSSQNHGQLQSDRARDSQTSRQKNWVRDSLDLLEGYPVKLGAVYRQQFAELERQGASWEAGHRGQFLSRCLSLVITPKSPISFDTSSLAE